MRCLRAALTAVLLCLHGAAVHASAAAPENVRIKCDDHRPMVSWDSPQPGTFTVKLSGSDRFSTQTEERELDLSEFVWTSAGQIFDYHFVTVTAQQGLNRSSHSPSFSYNKLKTVDQYCSLRFPPLSLTTDGSQATLTFENPLYFYKELKALRNSGHKLKYIVSHNMHQQDESCEAERVCKVDVSVDVSEDALPCVNLSGVVRRGGEVMVVTHQGPVCAEERPLPPELLWTVGAVVFVVFVAVIVVLVFLICKFRVWSFDKTQIPQTLAQMPQTHRPPSTHRPDTVYSQVQILGPRSQLSQDPHSPSPDSTEDQAEDQALIHDLEQDEDQALIHRPDQAEYRDGSINSTRTETSSIQSSEDEIQESNYERRGVLIEMDCSGDVVKGYTG